jgi:hypothetical protein
MKTAGAILILLAFAVAQTVAPTRVEWNASAPGALKELPDGRAQRTVAIPSAAISVIADITSARRFIDPPTDGGENVTYVVIGIRNTSQQTVHLDPGTITLRVVGKKEKELKRLTEEKVIERAWQSNDRVGGAIPPMVGRMGGVGAADDSLRAATAHGQLDTSKRAAQEVSERHTGQQIVQLKDKALLPRELAPGESVMGMVFFYPYEKKDKLELTIPVGDTTFVIPFSGKKKN